MVYAKPVSLLLCFTTLISSVQADGRRLVQRSVSNSCGHNYVQEQIVYPQYVQEQVYYFVGQPLRIESLMRLEREQYNNDRLQQEFKAFQAWRQQQKQSQKQQNQKHYQSEVTESTSCPKCKTPEPINPQPESTSEPPPTPNPENIPDPNSTPPNNQAGLFVQKCGKCHGGTTPKAQLTLALDTPINLKTYKLCVELMDSGKMPKGGPPLTSAEADQIKSELLQLTQ